MIEADRARDDDAADRATTAAGSSAVPVPHIGAAPVAHDDG